MKKYLSLKSVDEWNQYKISNKNIETIVFKFSPTCSISSSAENRINSWYADLEESVDLNIVKIDVINSRLLSQSLADEFNIIHQSPQVIWLDKNGNIKWNASHHKITKEALEEILNGKKVSS